MRGLPAVPRARGCSPDPNIVDKIHRMMKVLRRPSTTGMLAVALCAVFVMAATAPQRVNAARAVTSPAMQTVGRPPADPPAGPDDIRSGSAATAGTTPPDTAAARTLREITVSHAAATGRQATTTTAPLQRLDAAAMRNLGVSDAAEALKQMGGVSVRDYGGLGGIKTVSIRNLGAAHTAVCLDGVPVGNTLSGQIDLSRFGMDRVKEIALHIGSTDDLLAAARLTAAAGGIDITTDDTPHRLETRTAYGDWNTGEAALALAAPVGRRHRFRLAGTARHTDGNYPFTLTNGMLKTRERRRNGRVDDCQGEAAWTVRTDGGGRVDTQVRYYRGRRRLPGSIVFYNSAAHEQTDEENLLLQSRGRRRFGERWETVAALKYEHGLTRYHDEGTQYTGGRLDDTYRQDEYLLQSALLCRPTDRLALAIAHDRQWNTLRSSLPDCPYPLRHSAYTALRAAYRSDRLTAQAALLHTSVREHRQHRLPRGTAAASETPPPLGRDQNRWTPSLSLSWQPWAADLRLRLLCKRALRLPCFNDLYYHRIGNRGLRPEQADLCNVGATLIWHGLTATADAYYNRVRDKIVAFPSTFAWKMVNFGRVRISGADIVLNYRQPLGRQGSLTLTAAYNLQQATDRTDRQSSLYGHRIPYTALNSGTASAVALLPWVTLGYAAQWTGERYSNSMNTRRYRLAPFAEHSLTASCAFTLTTSRHTGRPGAAPPRLECYASLRNLTDHQYEVIQYYPMPGRQWRIGLRMTL